LRRARSQPGLAVVAPELQDAHSRLKERRQQRERAEWEATVQAAYSARAGTPRTPGPAAGPADPQHDETSGASQRARAAAALQAQLLGERETAGTDGLRTTQSAPVVRSRGRRTSKVRKDTGEGEGLAEAKTEGKVETKVEVKSEA